MPAFAPLQSQVDNNTCAALLRYRAPLALRPIICQENCSFHLMQLQPSLWHPSTAVSSTIAASIAAASGTIPDSICCSPRFIASIYISLKAMLQCPSTSASRNHCSFHLLQSQGSITAISTSVSGQYCSVHLLQPQASIYCSLKASFYYFSVKATLLRPSTAASRHHWSTHQLQPQGILTIHYTIFSASKLYYSVNLLQHRAAGYFSSCSVSLVLSCLARFKSRPLVFELSCSFKC